MDEHDGPAARFEQHRARPRAVADTFKGRARAAQLALVDGAAGAAWIVGGQPRVVFGFTIARGKIVAIDLLADPARLGQLDLVMLDQSRANLRSPA
ncbi:MAG TPA: hypothetical protein VL049_15610 [Candidatus Dormibacteraeota bacterium]|nr:hypothetical protein [Candidatus Dormibacteraeota bacterium]